MDLDKILAELRQERQLIDEVILSVERVAAGTKPKRGRRPAWLKAQRKEIGRVGAATVTTGFQP